MRRLLERINCVKEYPSSKFFAFGRAKVTESGTGAYREAEGRHMSRFGYRFTIEKVGRPHLAAIRYPDDKRRFMCIMDGTSYDLSTGIFTGLAQPLSERMLEANLLFWPRWKDCSIVFMTWGEGEPAAVSSIEVYELDRLPALPVPGDPRDGSRRELGIQYEDPCGTGGSEGAMNREEWLDRIVAYAKHTGQSLLVYPLAWYHGPQFPAREEPSDGFDLVVARDRRQYVRWTTNPHDWYVQLLERFGEEGLGFQGSLTLMRLGSLMQRMNTDIEAIRAGADTINNMLWNDHVQEGTNDWTPIYNARNFTRIVASLREGQRVEPITTGDVLPELAYGERRNPAYHPGPIFNPLHPAVQEAILGLVRDIGTRYARYPAFKGISFNMFAPTILWFGSLHSGYDDYTVGLFERETGIRVPVDPKSHNRFSRRHEFLTVAHRAAWVDWRCRKIRELMRSIRDVLASFRPDLRLVITLWDEPFIPLVLGQIGAAQQIFARQSNYALFKEAGIDIHLYRDEPGIQVDLGIGCARDRGGHGPSPAGGVTLPPEAVSMYRDHDFLDRETLGSVGLLTSPGAFIFNNWVEAWGRHVWFKPEPGDANAASLAVMDGKPADGILRVNSEYPSDGFWWDSQQRITPAFPGGVHFLEPYAHAVAELDACRITRGGLFLDKAHTKEIRQFAKAFRALPNEKFRTVGSTTDPVAVRTLLRDGIRYLYLVNREYYPITVKLLLSKRGEPLVELATGRIKVSSEGRLRTKLGPYELRSYSMSGSADVVSFIAEAPSELAISLAADARTALGAIERAQAAGLSIPGMEGIARGIRRALHEGRYAWLRRALGSYVVRKCRE